MEDNFILTTLEHLPNMDIEEHMGLVSGSAVIKGNGFKSLINSFKNFFGGELRELDQTFESTRALAIENLKEAAVKLGANTVINIRFESLRLSNGYCEIHVYGSAVKANAY